MSVQTVENPAIVYRMTILQMLQILVGPKEANPQTSKENLIPREVLEEINSKTGVSIQNKLVRRYIWLRNNTNAFPIDEAAQIEQMFVRARELELDWKRAHQS